MYYTRIMAVKWSYGLYTVKCQVYVLVKHTMQFAVAEIDSSSIKGVSQRSW